MACSARRIPASMGVTGLITWGSSVMSSGVNGMIHKSPTPKETLKARPALGVKGCVPTGNMP